MNPVTDNLDLWSSVVLNKSTAGRGKKAKQEAYGIKKLRELILELAVRGKLVAQDDGDEPAGVLLGRIAEERKELVKDGMIKKQKVLPPIEEDERPFDLPKEWIFERLGNLLKKISDGTHHSPPNVESGDFLYISAKNIKKEGVQLSNATYVTEEVHQEIYSRCDPEYGDLLYIKDGATTGIATINQLNEPFSMLSSVALLKCPKAVLNHFLLLSLRAPYFYAEMRAGMTGVAITRVTLKKLNHAFIALPPLSEQSRIVAKVDELMALCDQLEQQQTDSIAAHQTLVETLLGTLVNVESQQELTEAWNRLANHFDTLFTTEQSIDQLKQAILQLAVMGKLVPQDPEDEPAGVLLERIAQEKERLVGEGKIKKKKRLAEISDDEIPFIIPKGWAFLRFGEIGEIMGGGTPNKSNPKFWDGDIPWISPKDMKVDYISGSADKITSDAVEGSTVKLVPVGSLLLVVRGMILLHSFPVAITQVAATINQDMKAINLNGHNRDFILLMIKGIRDEVLDLVDRSTHGTCKLVSEKLWNKVLPIPPLPEQNRIVKKVNQLTTLCDTLKSRLNEAQTTKTHLADAIVKQAVV